MPTISHMQQNLPFATEWVVIIFFWDRERERETEAYNNHQALSHNMQNHRLHFTNYIPSPKPSSRSNWQGTKNDKIYI